MSKRNFIEDCYAAASCTMAHSRNELNLFCEIMGLPKSKVNYFICDDPHGVVDIMEGYYCFNMSDIHVVISEYERWLKIYGDNKGIRKAVDAWYYYCQEWHEKHSYEEPRWVSVEERLPEKDGDYLTLFKRNNYMCILQFENNYWKVAGYQSDITHWKPIITPQQEAERSKGCPNLRSWLAGCPVDGLRDATLEWQTQREMDLQAAH